MDNIYNTYCDNICTLTVYTVHCTGGAHADIILIFIGRVSKVYLQNSSPPPPPPPPLGKVLVPKKIYGFRYIQCFFKNPGKHFHQNLFKKFSFAVLFDQWRCKGNERLIVYKFAIFKLESSESWRNCDLNICNWHIHFCQIKNQSK